MVDIVIDKYYLIEYYDFNYYIKCCKITNEYIHAMYFVKTKLDGTFLEYNHVKCLSECFYKKSVIKEVSFLDIVNYLPNDNPDKVIYLRKQRINKLLGI